MFHSGESLCVVGELVGKELQGDVPTELEVFRLVDHAHSPAADLAEDAVMGNCLPYGLGGRRHCVHMLGGGEGKVKRRTVHQWRRERANPAISSVPEPSPIRWSERVSAASPVFAVFSPRFTRCLRIAEIGQSVYLVERAGSQPQ
jgi:hypothetical protein